MIFSNISYSSISPEEFHVQIPEELGRIRNSYFTTVKELGRPGSPRTNGPFIVHIQDSSGQLTAQRNTQKILKHLVEKYEFDTLFLDEGLDGYSINNEWNVRAYELGKPELYQESFLAFQKISNRKKELDAFFADLKIEIDRLTSYYFNSDLKKFLRDWLSFQGNQKEILAHLGTLDQYAKQQLKIDFRQAKNKKDYPQLVRYFSIRDFQRRFESGNIQHAMAQEKKQLDKWLAKQGFDPIYSQIFEALLNYSYSPLESSYPVDIRLFLERFYTVAKPKGFSFGPYSYFMRHLGMMLLAQELDSEAFFDEIKRLNVDILKSLARTPEENSLVRLLRDYILMKKLFFMELSQEEFAEIKKKEKIMSPGMLLGRFRMLENETVKVLIDVSSSMNEVFKEALRFYTLAEEREGTMFNSILSVLDTKPVRKIILVTRNLHNSGLGALMREKGFSFLEVSPSGEVTSST